MERELHTYVLVLRAGPGSPTADVAVEFLDQHGQQIARYEETWFAFGQTWRDVAHLIASRAVRLGVMAVPASTPSPHIDLT